MTPYSGGKRLPGRNGGLKLKRKKKMKDDQISSVRADIENRVSQFRENQAKLQRDREGYYDAVIEKVRSTEWNEFVTPHPAPKVAAR
jgi:transposase-like protein